MSMTLFISMPVQLLHGFKTSSTNSPASQNELTFSVVTTTAVKSRNQQLHYNSRGRTAMEGVAADATRSSDRPSSAANGGVTVQECEKMVKKSLRTPMVKFLREHLAKSGCHIGDNFFKAVDCTNAVSGGYARGVGIMVCSNNIDLQDEVNQVVIHELIHAYDDCRAGNMEWTNCAHHVCSEIRAGHLSGDCHYKRELLRGYMKIRGHEQDCVKRRVMMSMVNNPYCSEAASKDAMEAVWDVCYNDTKPFDRAP